ncbi:hypothetical protein [Actinomadura sp. DC4]|uniref:hypothetical protein n=1 Tax=Actinomadura sp. DC4 TaxID=3055069 RepID=UPI0025AF7E13|nr:hypothetical protein [Actinomadura sp. DC4]MDN3354345.1 hypothetical protein [Actinomadura sp. DC4]
MARSFSGDLARWSDRRQTEALLAWMHGFVRHAAGKPGMALAVRSIVMAGDSEVFR